MCHIPPLLSPLTVIRSNFTLSKKTGSFQHMESICASTTTDLTRWTLFKKYDGVPRAHGGEVVYQFFEANTQHRHLSRNNVECLEKYGWFIWPYYNKHYNPFQWFSTPLMSMEHSLHPNMNSGISVINNTFIHFSSYKQFCKDTHSIVLIYPVKYLVKWVSILNSRNSDDL